MMISFFAEGEPKGQPRPRAFAFHGHARIYDAGTAEGWKSQVALAAKPHRPDAPINGPVKVVMRFFMPRPKNHFRSGKLAGVLRANAPGWHTAKPDCDNLAKAVLDVLKTIGMFRDDSQVAWMLVSKHYGKPTGVKVEIEELI